MNSNKSTFIIKKHKKPVNPQFAKRRFSAGIDDNEQQSDGKDAKGCIWMLVGFLLGPVGLILAAIFGRVKGAVAALVGLAIWAILWMSGYCTIIINFVHHILSSH